MTTAISRAEIYAIAALNGDDTFLPGADPSVGTVRGIAALWRAEAHQAEEVDIRQARAQQADELDALADRYEREASR